MRSARLATGRVHVLRLEEGEIVHEAVESFCRANGISCATVALTGAVGAGSVIVSGPRVPIEDGIEPETIVLDAPCELAGSGTVFPDEGGSPVAHLHGAVGRKGFSAVGDLCHGMSVWLVMEAVVTELEGSGPVRRQSDPRLEGRLLEISRWHQRRY